MKNGRMKYQTKLSPWCFESPVEILIIIFMQILKWATSNPEFILQQLTLAKHSPVFNINMKE